MDRGDRRDQGLRHARRARPVPDRDAGRRGRCGCARRARSTAPPPAGRGAAAGSTCRRCATRRASTASTRWSSPSSTCSTSSSEIARRGGLRVRGAEPVGEVSAGAALDGCRPVWRTFPGWRTRTRSARRFEDLPTGPAAISSGSRAECGVPIVDGLSRVRSARPRWRGAERVRGSFIWGRGAQWFCPRRCGSKVESIAVESSRLLEPGASWQFATSTWVTPCLPPPPRGPCRFTQSDLPLHRPPRSGIPIPSLPGLPDGSFARDTTFEPMVTGDEDMSREDR